MSDKYKPPPIRYRISDIMAENVSNQKGEGVCLSMSITDAMSIIIRPYINDPYLILSPQILIDSKKCVPKYMVDEHGPVFQIDYKELASFCCDTLDGLERITDYPLIRMGRSLEAWNHIGYRLRDNDRFNDLFPVFGSENIIKALCDNFGVDGPKLPMVGAMIIGTLENSEIAKSMLTYAIHHIVLPMRI